MPDDAHHTCGTPCMRRETAVRRDPERASPLRLHGKGDHGRYLRRRDRHVRPAGAGGASPCRPELAGEEKRHPHRKARRGEDDPGPGARRPHRRRESGQAPQRHGHRRDRHEQAEGGFRLRGRHGNEGPGPLERGGAPGERHFFHRRGPQALPGWRRQHREHAQAPRHRRGGARGPCHDDG